MELKDCIIVDEEQKTIIICREGLQGWHIEVKDKASNNPKD